MISLGTEQYHVGGEDNSDKIKLFLFLSLMCPNLWGSPPTFQWSSGTSPLESFTSPKALLSVGDWLRRCSLKSPGLWWRGAGAGSQDTAGSTASTEICILLRNTQMGKAFYGSCGILCRISYLHQGTVGGCQIIVEEGVQMRDVLFGFVADITPRSALILDFKKGIWKDYLRIVETLI